MAHVIDAVISLRDNFTATMDKATKSMLNSAKQAQQAGRDIEKTGKNLSTIGGALTKTVTAPIVAAGAGLLKIAEDFETAENKIRAGTGKTGTALEGLVGDFKKVYSSVPASMDDASEAVTELNKRLGLSGKPLQDLSEQVLRVSKLTGTDLATELQSSSRMLQDAGIKQSDYSKALDYTYKVSQQTGVGLDTLQQAMVKYGAPLREMGFNWQTSAAMLGKFEKEGVNTELVMGSMRIALGKMAKEGIKDPTQALETMVKQIKNAGSTGQANALALQMFGARAGPDMAAAIREGHMDLQGLMASLQKSPETIKKAASAVSTPMGRLKTIGHQMQTALEPVATSLLKDLEKFEPSLIKLAGYVQKFADWLGKLSPQQKDMAVKLLAIAAAAGPVLSVTGNIIKTVGSTKVAIGGLTKTGAGVLKFFKNFGGNMDTVALKGMYFGDNLKKVGSAALSGAKSVAGFASTTGTKLANGLKTAGGAALSGAKSVAGFTADLGKNALGLAKTAAGAIKSGAAFVIQKGAMLASSLATKAATAAQRLFNTSLFGCPVVWIIAGIAAIIAIVILMVTHWKQVSTFFKGLWKDIIGIFSAAWKFLDTGTGQWIQVMLAIFVPFLGIPILIIKHWSQISAFFKGFWGDITSGFKGFINLIISGLDILIGGLDKLKISVPKGIPIIGGKSVGFNIPLIPHFEKGTPFFGGGTALVGERGPELITMPRGSQVTNNTTTNKVLNQKNGGVTIQKLADTLVVREEADIDKLSTAMVKKIKEAEVNYAPA